MITITHDKILGFAPLWAPYNGFSLLFNNPDNGFSPLRGDVWILDGPMKLDSMPSDPTLILYQAFVDVLNSIDLNILTNTYLFCPLPSSTYHVTVWDGLNVGNIRDEDPSDLDENSSGWKKWAYCVRNLPRTFRENREFTHWANVSPLTQNSDWNITFRYDTLHKWSSGMGILLKPADRESERLLKEIKNHREALYENFPIEIKHSEYAPHVTLGYFANKESAQLATPLIADWAKIFEESTRGLTITYHSISLYGFTDMITFFKPWWGG